MDWHLANDLLDLHDEASSAYWLHLVSCSCVSRPRACRTRRALHAEYLRTRGRLLDEMVGA